MLETLYAIGKGGAVAMAVPGLPRVFCFSEVHDTYHSISMDELAAM